MLRHTGRVDDPLLGARLKVERALQHLDSLREQTRTFTESDPYRTVIEADPETGDQVVRIRFTHAERRIPRRLGLVAGDAIHNLRSALDHLTWQLAVLGTGPGRRTQFPLFDDPNEYRRNEAQLLEGIAKGHRARIETLQPYHVKALVAVGGGLSGLHDPLVTNLSLMPLGRLDNTDKHRLLLPIIGIAAWSEPKFEGVKHVTGTYPGSWVRMDDGAELFRITEWELLPGTTNVKVEHEPTYTILFGDPEFVVANLWSDRDKSAVSAADLFMTADRVLGIIDSFAPDFA